jgi:hypothetical protein
MRNARAISILLFSVLAVGCSRAIVQEKILFVAAQTVPCVKDGVQGIFIPQDPSKAVNTCIQTSESSTGPYYANEIVGFKFEPGYRYKLRVRSTYPNTGMVDEQTTIELLETLEKTPAN